MPNYIVTIRSADLLDNAESQAMARRNNLSARLAQARQSESKARRGEAIAKPCSGEEAKTAKRGKPKTARRARLN